MRLLMLIGGMLGFGTGVGFAWSENGERPSALWRGSLVAFAAGFLFRWWGKVWVRSLEEVHLKKLEDAAKEHGTTKKR